MITPYQNAPPKYLCDLSLRGKRIHRAIVRFFGVKGKIPL